MKVVCTKDLYRSIYRGLAFKQGKEYAVSSEDDEFIFIKDETGHDFNFAKSASNTYYIFNDYFMVAVAQW